MEPVKVEVSGTLKHEFTNPISIEVTRGQKGNYGWTIKVAGTDRIDILHQIELVDDQLRQHFPQPEGEEKK